MVDQRSANYLFEEVIGTYKVLEKRILRIVFIHHLVEFLIDETGILFINLEDVMELSQEEKDKLYELIDKLNPCVAIASKETIERFKEWTGGQVKVFEISDDEKFLSNDMVYLIPVDSLNKPIKVIIYED